MEIYRFACAINDGIRNIYSVIRCLNAEKCCIIIIVVVVIVAQKTVQIPKDYFEWLNYLRLQSFYLHR